MSRAQETGSIISKELPNASIAKENDCLCCGRMLT